MVVVAVNYRLGPLGWMAHPAFGAQANGGYALEDQRAALRWVQRNIARFGGDPARVTIGGVSAGAASVCMHLISPEATTGLFHQAIIQSSGCTFALRSLEEGKNAGLAVAKLVGCDDPATALRVPARQAGKGTRGCRYGDCQRRLPRFAPIYGNGTVPRQGAEAFATGNFVRVPILNGGASYEMRLYVGYEVEAGGRIDAGNYAARLRALYGDHADQVLAAYPASSYSSPATALGTAMSDYMPGGGLNACLFLRTAWMASRFVPVYQYEFADDAAPPSWTTRASNWARSTPPKCPTSSRASRTRAASMVRRSPPRNRNWPGRWCVTGAASCTAANRRGGTAGMENVCGARAGTATASRRGGHVRCGERAPVRTVDEAVSRRAGALSRVGCGRHEIRRRRL